MSSEDETSQDRPRERLPNTGQQLLRIDEDGTVRDPIPPEVREKFNDNLFSAVYDGGRILLQEVK